MSLSKGIRDAVRFAMDAWEAADPEDLLIEQTKKQFIKWLEKKNYSWWDKVRGKHTKEFKEELSEMFESEALNAKIKSTIKEVPNTIHHIQEKLSKHFKPEGNLGLSKCTVIPKELILKYNQSKIVKELRYSNELSNELKENDAILDFVMSLIENRIDEISNQIKVKKKAFKIYYHSYVIYDNSSYVWQSNSKKGHFYTTYRRNETDEIQSSESKFANEFEIKLSELSAEQVKALYQLAVKNTIN